MAEPPAIQSLLPFRSSLTNMLPLRSSLTYLLPLGSSLNMFAKDLTNTTTKTLGKCLNLCMFAIIRCVLVIYTQILILPTVTTRHTMGEHTW